MAKQQNPSAVVLWKAKLEQILKVQAAGDKSGKTLVVKSFSSSPDGIYQHDVNILTDLQRGKYALVPCDRGLPRIQTVDVLQRGLQMLHPDVADVRHYFWGFEPVRTPLFGHTWYAVQALGKGFIDQVQDGLGKYQVNIQHLGLLITELARAAAQQWGPKCSLVLLNEYQYGQLDLGLLYQGELLYTRHLADVSQIRDAMQEAQDRFDLYYPKKKMPASLPLYLTGHGPLARDIVLQPQLQMTVNEAHLLQWWPWPETWAIENTTDLAHSEEEEIVSEFRKAVEEHWSLLLTQLAPPPERGATGAQTLWKWIAALVFLLGLAGIAISGYIAHQISPVPVPSITPAAPNRAVVLRQSKALGEEVKRLERESSRIKNSVRPIHMLTQALQRPLPARYRLEGITGVASGSKRVYLHVIGPPAKQAQGQLISHLKQLKTLHGGALLHNIRSEPAAHTPFRGVMPARGMQHIYLSGELSG